MFTIDIFISYAHIDDESLLDGEKGWITTFHTALERRLSQIVGERLNIWRDVQRLEGTDMFAEKIVGEFPKTAMMISIITPRYVKSEWCIKEVDEFVRVANTNVGFQIGDKIRILKVIKTPVPLDQHPVAIRDVLGYEFFKVNPTNKRLYELKPVGNASDAYFEILDDLAYELKNILEKIRVAEKAGTVNQPAPATISVVTPPSPKPEAMTDADRLEILKEYADLFEAFYADRKISENERRQLDRKKDKYALSQEETQAIEVRIMDEAATADALQEKQIEAERLKTLEVETHRMRLEEQKRLEAERKAVEEAENTRRVLAEKEAAEKLALEKAEAERKAAEEAENTRRVLETRRVLAEKEAAEKLALEKAEAERKAAEEAEQTRRILETRRVLAEKEAAEKLAMEKAEAERKAAEEAENTRRVLETRRVLAEKEAAEKLALEKAEAERKAAEEAEQTQRVLETRRVSNDKADNPNRKRIIYYAAAAVLVVIVGIWGIFSLGTDNAWEQATQENTLEAYQNYLQSGGKKTTQATDSIARFNLHLLFTNALQKQNLQTWQQLDTVLQRTLANSPAWINFYKEKTAYSIDSLQQAGVYNTAQNANDLNAYLSKYPNGFFTTQAKEKIEYWGNAELRHADSIAWLAALKANTLEAFEKYKTANPKGVNFDEANTKIANIKAEAQRQAQAAKDIINRIAANMVQISGGTFQMGSSASEVGRGSNELQHSVTLSSFYMGKYEVTQAEYKAIMGKNPSRFKGDNLPVETVSWNDAQAFIKTLNKLTGKKYRLPTEAEWEYACRAGTSTPFNTGNNLSTNQANYDGNNPYNGNAKGTYRQKTTSVGSFSPNAWGLYDMHGNVWEWCQDWYADYSSGSQTNPKGPNSGSDRVLRGGSWNDSAAYCRSAYRRDFNPGYRYDSIGFRLALSL